MQSFLFSPKQKIISMQKVVSLGPVDRNTGQFSECSQNSC